MCRKNQKISSSQRTAGEAAVANVTQIKNQSSVKSTAPVPSTADVPATLDVNQYLNCESATDNLGRKSGSDAEGPKTEGASVLVKSVTHSQTDAATSASSSVDGLSTDAMSSEDNSADKVEQLRKLIDHATGQLYTIADVYLMMMKPSRVPLEYDWVSTSTDGVAAASMDDVSTRLRKLVGIAKSAFTVSAAKPRVCLNTRVVR